MKIIKNMQVSTFIILVFLTPLFNTLSNDLYISAWACLFLFGILCIDYKKINKNFLLISLLLGLFQLILQENFLKAIAAAFIFYVCIDNFINNLSTTTKAIYFIMLINVVFLILQLLGINDNVYIHNNYANEAQPLSILNDNNIEASYLPQFRPSGIFPAPTFISFFCILILSISLHLLTNNRFILIFIGIMYALTGSTMGLLMSAIFLIYCIRARFFYIVPLTYVVTLYMYFKIFEPFFRYNFSYEDLIESTLNRRLSESIYTENPILLLLITVIFMAIIFFLIRKYGFKSIINLIPGYIVIFLPIILHDFSTSLIFSLFLAYGIAMIKTSRLTL